MTKISCVVLGFLLTMVGIMGLADFSIQMNYVYFTAIAFGIAGIFVGVYAKRRIGDHRLITETATQKNEMGHQNKEIDDLNTQIEKLKVDLYQQKKEVEQQKDKIKKLESSV